LDFLFIGTFAPELLHLHKELSFRNLAGKFPLKIKDISHAWMQFSV